MRTTSETGSRDVRKARASGSARADGSADRSIDNFLPVTWDVDISLPISQRPLTGADIRWFASRHNLKLADVIYALCIQNSAKYNETLRLKSLPFTLELLIRLYDKFPKHSPWTPIRPDAAFSKLYGENMKEFVGRPNELEARRALYWRFTSALGRSVFTAYRWLQLDGAAKPQILKIFAKLAEVENGRQALEEISRLMFKVRHADLDAEYPMPTHRALDSPPPPPRRGPPIQENPGKYVTVKKSVKKAAKAASQKSKGAKAVGQTRKASVVASTPAKSAPRKPKPKALADATTSAKSKALKAKSTRAAAASSKVRDVGATDTSVDHAVTA